MSETADQYSRIKCSECGCSIGFIHYLQNVEGSAMCDDCFYELQRDEDEDEERN